MVKLKERILISAPRDTVRAYLQDIGNIPRYEKKAGTLAVTDSDAKGHCVAASGKFLGLPWRGQFRLEFTPDGGYRAHMTRGPLKAMTASYHLRPVPGGTLVTHEEHYHFPVLLKPVMLLVKDSLRQTLEKELRIIKEGAECLNRRLQLEAIE